MGQDAQVSPFHLSDACYLETQLCGLACVCVCANWVTTPWPKCWASFPVEEYRYMDGALPGTRAAGTRQPSPGGARGVL